MSKNKKLKILIVSWWFYPEIGAGTNRVLDLIKYLPQEKFELYVLCRKNEKSTYKSELFLKHENSSFPIARIYRAPTFMTYAWLNVPAMLIFFIISFLIILIKKIDIVFMTVPEIENVLASFFSAKILRKPCIVDVRDRWEAARIDFIESNYFPFSSRSMKSLFKIYTILLKNVFKLVYRSCVALTVVTLSIAKYFKHNRMGKRIYVVPNAADITIFKPMAEKARKQLRSKLGISEDALVIVFEGTLAPEYRMDLVLAALRDLKFNKVSNFVLLIVGKIPDWSREKAKIDYLVEKFCLKENVKFLGSVPSRKTVAKIIAISDLGIIPLEIKDVWKYRVPLKFYEYLSCGIPVIAFCSKDSELYRLITKYNCGIAITNHKNIAENLANILMKISAKKDEIKEKMGRNGLLLVRKVFNRAITAKMFEKIFLSVKNS